MKFTLTGIVLIIAGIWVKAHFSADARICDSPMGGVAQMFSSTAQQDCSQVRVAVAIAPWAIGIGIAMVAISGLFILGVIGASASTTRKNRKG